MDISSWTLLPKDKLLCNCASLPSVNCVNPGPNGLCASELGVCDAGTSAFFPVPIVLLKQIIILMVTTIVMELVLVLF